MREENRIDGSNHDAFWQTYALLSQGLAPEEVVAFQVAIQRVLTDCMLNIRLVTPEKGNDPDQFQLQLQRRVNGLSFFEIVALGKECASRNADL